eukprot:TRINITY_DN103174_c0_g1_i1.p1 TRINITY_DN103174_c0_g1~~TRINITY_DN103174_c0_g1_i1.p1  ORF type:complete len:527 (+),score=84.02 TRINITY_DN103174_c0_g1_i1:71-1651(+)
MAEENSQAQTPAGSHAIFVRTMDGSTVKQLDISRDTTVEELRRLVCRDMNIPEWYTFTLVIGGRPDAELVSLAEMAEGDEVTVVLQAHVDCAMDMLQRVVKAYAQSESEEVLIRHAPYVLQVLSDSELEVWHWDHILYLVEYEVAWWCSKEAAYFGLVLGTIFERPCPFPVDSLRRLLAILQCRVRGPHVLSTAGVFAIVGIMRIAETQESAFNMAIAQQATGTGSRFLLDGTAATLVCSLRALHVDFADFAWVGICVDFVGKFGARDALHQLSQTGLHVLAGDAGQWGAARARIEARLSTTEQDATQSASRVHTQARESSSVAEKPKLELSLEAPLHDSEAAMLLKEQADVHEALLRSKATPCIKILKFSQTKAWFREALLDGTYLQEERAALEAAGLSPKLASGAKIFVELEFYRLVLQKIEEDGHEMTTSHLVVSETMESRVLTAIALAMSTATKRQRGTCKVNPAGFVKLPVAPAANSEDESEASQAESQPLYTVERTFVNVAERRSFSSMPSESSFRAHSV